MRPRTFVLGDSHGAYRAFLQVMERSAFNYSEDTMICLGDVSDGWPEIPELLDEMLKIKNLIFVRGNHDQWLKDFLKDGKQPDVWLRQGGEVTRDAYYRGSRFIRRHLSFLRKTPFYHIDEKKRLFVHGGFTFGVRMEKQDKMVLMWDRSLWEYSNIVDNDIIPDFKEIFVGHTSIYKFSHKPIQKGNIWFMDTGAGWEGVLSLMDVDTKEVFQSDLVKDLYPEVKGRN